MLIKTRWRALCYCILLVISVHTKADADVIGTAYSPGSDRVLYTESYSADSATRVRVKYESAAGTLLAEKQLDFSRDRHAPDVIRKDYRFDSTLTINTEANTTTLQSQRNGEAAWDATLDVAEKLVIDAGFDFFVQDKWRDLMAGKEIKFKYLLPARKTAIKLKLKQSDCATAEQGVCFRIKARNWIIAAIMAPIDLEYEPGKRRLMRFSGLGQLPDSNEKQQEVDIRYRYPTKRSSQQTYSAQLSRSKQQRVTQFISEAEFMFDKSK